MGSRKKNAIVIIASLSCAACALKASEPRTVAVAEIPLEADPMGIGSPVTLERRDSNACPDTEGGEMWYAKLSGIVAVTVTYGVRFNGSDDGRRHTMDLNPRYSRERQMFCTGDGVNLDFEPFIVAVETS